MTYQRLKLGSAGEQIAADHLAARGFALLDRNYRTRFGELDLVAGNGRTIVFVEVKSRTRTGFELSPLLSVGTRKRAQVRRLAEQWLLAHPGAQHSRELRFDAIGVHLSHDGTCLAIDHIEGAF